MIGPDDMLIAAAAASLRRKRPPRRMTRGEARRLVDRALAAWPRLRPVLFGELRQIAA
jgi:hypothetical protein